MTTSEMTPADFAAINGNNDGWGGGNGWWILLLFLFGMNGGWFGNGYGNNGGGFVGADIQRGFDQSAVISGINTLNGNVTNGFAQAEISANARQIADMNQNFAAQTALTNNLFGIQSSLQNCCCENRAATQDLKYTVATESCATRTADAANTSAVLNALNAGVQSIKDQLCSDKIEEKNDIIAQLRSELLYARGQASQDVQTAAIQAGQRALANEVEQYVLPTPRPAYLVQNPNCCAPVYGGCGCGSF